MTMKPSKIDTSDNAPSATMKPAAIDTSYVSEVKQATGTELHVSPHGTVRSFRGTAAPSATLRDENARVPTALEPSQHSLPTALPSKTGEVMIVDGQPLARWDLGPKNKMRPITFKPNGSFKVLAHKLIGTSFH